MKLSRPLVFFDIESTGLEIVTDRIVDIALVKCGNSLEPIDSLQLLVNPGMPIPPSATAIHHITDADVKGKPGFTEVAPKIHAFLHGCDIAGYNLIRYDVPLLAEEFARAGLLFPEEDTKIVDVQTIFVRQEPRNLSAAYGFYCGKSFENVHNALADVTATLEVFRGQLAKYADLPGNVAELHAFCGADEMVDPAGKLKRLPNGDIVFSFGKHRGDRVIDHPDYAAWMISKDFPVGTKKILERICKKP